MENTESRKARHEEMMKGNLEIEAQKLAFSTQLAVELRPLKTRDSGHLG